jgi:hypothetical protein
MPALHQDTIAVWPLSHPQRALGRQPDEQAYLDARWLMAVAG